MSVNPLKATPIIETTRALCEKVQEQLLKSDTTDQDRRSEKTTVSFLDSGMNEEELAATVASELLGDENIQTRKIIEKALHMVPADLQELKKSNPDDAHLLGRLFEKVNFTSPAALVESGRHIFNQLSKLTNMAA